MLTRIKNYLLTKARAFLLPELHRLVDAELDHAAKKLLDLEAELKGRVTGLLDDAETHLSAKITALTEKLDGVTDVLEGPVEEAKELVEELNELLGKVQALKTSIPFFRS